MALKEPESMEEIVYFTNRTIGEGKAMTWVFKKECPKCGKAKMGKPKDEKGKVAIRAKEYICPACNYTVEKTEYEESLDCNVKYTCPSCKFEGEKVVPFKRKNINGVPTIRIQCGKCNANIDITKKMKAAKKKGEAVDDDF